MGVEHEALEAELAAFTGRERALVFSTGYMANMGVIGALADQKSLWSPTSSIMRH